jgi:hypothetical protein
MSRPTVLSRQQEETFQAWSTSLAELGFQLQRLQRQNYSDQPWNQLWHILAHVDGIAAFGFWQDSAESGALTRSMHTSPWTHIEAAMAIAASTPVLALPELGIEDGIFDPSVWSGYLHGIPAGIPPSRNAIPGRWIDAVYFASISRQRTSSRETHKLVPSERSASGIAGPQAGLHEPRSGVAN